MSEKQAFAIYNLDCLTAQDREKIIKNNDITTLVKCILENPQFLQISDEGERVPLDEISFNDKGVFIPFNDENIFTHMASIFGATLLDAKSGGDAMQVVMNSRNTMLRIAKCRAESQGDLKAVEEITKKIEINSMLKGLAEKLGLGVD